MCPPPTSQISPVHAVLTGMARLTVTSPPIPKEKPQSHKGGQGTSKGSTGHQSSGDTWRGSLDAFVKEKLESGCQPSPLSPPETQGRRPRDSERGPEGPCKCGEPGTQCMASGPVPTRRTRLAWEKGLREAHPHLCLVTHRPQDRTVPSTHTPRTSPAAPTSPARQPHPQEPVRSRE